MKKYKMCSRNSATQSGKEIPSPKKCNAIIFNNTTCCLVMRHAATQPYSIPSLEPSICNVYLHSHVTATINTSKNSIKTTTKSDHLSGCRLTAAATPRRVPRKRVFNQSESCCRRDYRRGNTKCLSKTVCDDNGTVGFLHFHLLRFPLGR